MDLQENALKVDWHKARETIRQYTSILKRAALAHVRGS